jgi:hypothetical protein
MRISVEILFDKMVEKRMTTISGKNANTFFEFIEAKDTKEFFEKYDC